MPVSHRMIPHWKYIKTGIYTRPQSGLYIQKRLVILHLSRQGKIKVAACHIQIMNWQLCKISRLNGIFKCSLICPASAECPKPGKIIQTLAQCGMIHRYRPS